MITEILNRKSPNYRSIGHKRAVRAYQSLATSRNTIIDKFNFEFNRHVKLICKKTEYRLANEELKNSVRLSLSKSRNMKRIQTEMTDIRNLIKQSQIDCKNIKYLKIN